MLRSPLRRVAVLAAHHPIEAIVVSFVLATVAYFQLLFAIKQSEFLRIDSSHQTKTFYLNSAQQPEAPSTVQLRQVVLSSKPEFHHLEGESISQEFKEKLRSLSPKPQFYFGHYPNPDTFSLSFGFPNQQQANIWDKSLDSLNLSLFDSDSLSVQSIPDTRQTYQTLLNGPVNFQDDFAPPLTPSELGGGKWILHAGRSFVLRLWNLAKNADSADIFVMLVGYILMHATFVSLFLNMRKLGSRFWLGASVLLSGVFALLLALLTACFAGFSINSVLLSEALPFLVITVGFEKPITLARAVYSNPDIAPLIAQSDSGIANNNANNNTTGNSNNNDDEKKKLGASTASATGATANSLRWASPPSARDVVVSAVQKVGPQIIRDYFIEVSILVFGATIGIGGLREFCGLAALILTYDCLFLFLLFTAVLTVMVEVHRIKIMQGVKRADSSVDLARILDNTLAEMPNIDLGIPTPGGPLNPNLSSSTASSSSSKSENPTVRLKVLLISSLIIVHVLNLATTLNDSTGRFWYRDDASDSPIVPLLDNLSQAGYDIAYISRPFRYQIISSSAAVGIGAVAGSGSALKSAVASSSLFAKLPILSVVADWAASIINDPILSKWIVVLLGVSVILNGFLLKGLAVGGHSGSAAETARMLLNSTRIREDSQKNEQTRHRMRRRWSGGLEGLSTLQGGWSLADAAEMAKQRRVEMELEEQKRDLLDQQQQQQQQQHSSRSRSDSAESSTQSQPPSPLFTKQQSANRKNNNQGKPSIGADANSSSNTTTLATGITAATGTTTATSSVTTTDTSISTDSTKTPNIKISESDGIITPATTVPDDLSTPRPLEQVIEIFDSGNGRHQVSDEEVIMLVQRGKIAAYALEKLLDDAQRAVGIRRSLISRASYTKSLENSLLPYTDYDYSKVIGQCCENVVGYCPIPVGIAGPLRIDGQPLPIPMATTEGALVASTSRGCKALNACGGVTTVLNKDAMTRGPCLEFPSISMCNAAKLWIDSEQGSSAIKTAFHSTSRYARLINLKPTMAGRLLFVRFETQTGDAMGMNMISKGTECALKTMMDDYFPEMRIVSLSGNYCIDKKPGAINWIEGRGKSVVAEGIITGDVVKSVLKTTVEDVVKLNLSKNFIGSAMAGSIGGNNAHASNILTAIYLATGQDPAQNVESSNCMTQMEAINDGKDLLITCTMPSIEVGTIGGGTILPPQQAMLELLGVKGANQASPGDNARRLARIICAAVMAGELSLMCALSAGHLVKAHLAHNRSAAPSTAKTLGHTFLTPDPTRPATPGIVSKAPSFTSTMSSSTSSQ